MNEPPMPDVLLNEQLGTAPPPRCGYELGEADDVEHFVKRCANGTDAARGISSRARADEVFGILAPIGTEKSTTSGMLGTQIRPVLDGLVREPCVRRSDAYTRDEDEIQSLREAVKRLDGLARPIERARANAELGVVLRRAGRPVEARQPLRVAVDLAHHCGARDLEDWAMRELRAAGARPRRRVMTGVGALTPSERRIAELAAAGQRNRDIAATLFVTLATVEFHLRNAYRKLGIASRKGLKHVLPAVPDVGPRVVGSSVAAADAGLGYRWELGSSAATATSWAPAR